MSWSILTGTNQTQYWGLVGNQNNTALVTIALTTGDLVAVIGSRAAFSANFAFTYNSGSSSGGATTPTISKVLNSTGSGTTSSSAAYWFIAPTSGNYVFDMSTIGSGTNNTTSAVSIFVVNGHDPSNPFIAANTGDASFQAGTTGAGTATFSGYTEPGSGPALFLLQFAANHLNTGGVTSITSPFATGSGWVAVPKASGVQALTSSIPDPSACCAYYIINASGGSTGTISATTTGTAGLFEQHTYIALRPLPGVAGTASIPLGTLTLANTGIGTHFGSAAVPLGTLNVNMVGPAPTVTQSEFFLRKSSGGSYLRSNDTLRGSAPQPSTAAISLGTLTLGTTGTITGTKHGSASLPLDTFRITTNGVRTTFGTANLLFADTGVDPFALSGLGSTIFTTIEGTADIPLGAFTLQAHVNPKGGSPGVGTAHSLGQAPRIGRGGIRT